MTVCTTKIPTITFILFMLACPINEDLRASVVLFMHKIVLVRGYISTILLSTLGYWKKQKCQTRNFNNMITNLFNNRKKA